MNDTIQAAIFDLDGVLTDTIEPHYRSWQALMDECGIPFDRALNEKLRGRGRPESLEIILGARTGEFPAERKAALLSRKNELFLELIAGMGPADLYPGVRELLEELKRRGLPLAVASSSRNAETILARLGIRGIFRAVVDANEVAESKPHPRVYLLAAERLGVAPERCVAIEDGASGIEAARAAGMTVVGVGPIERVGRAHRTCPDMQTLTANRLLGV
jgi:beta-phosphoglucomutase